MERVLNKFIRRDTKTVDLMDEFEIGNYDALILEGFFYVSDQGKFYFVAIKIKHHELGTLDIDYSGMTFTDYKKKVIKKVFSINDETPYSLVNYALKMISENQNQITSTEFQEFPLPKPQTFSAQNSGDRCDYGYEWERNGKEMVLVKEGNHYGDTTTYEVVSVLAKREPEEVHSIPQFGKKYVKFSKIIKEFNLSDSEVQDVLKKYPKIEKKYVEVNGNRINWENSIDC